MVAGEWGRALLLEYVFVEVNIGNKDALAEAKRLREGHFSATSNYGNCILFDGNGIHRGGMVNKGERRCIFILLAEI